MANIYRVSIGQDDCPHTYITMKYPNIQVFIMNSQGDGHFQKSFSIIVSNTDRGISEAIKSLETYPGLTCLNVLGIQDRIASLTYKFPQTSAYSVVNTMGFRMHPITVKNGIEKWFFVTSNSEVQNIVKQKLSDDKTQLISFKRLTTEEFMADYSRILGEFWSIQVMDKSGISQNELLKEAINAGYFSWPRKASLSELSAKMNIPRTTLSYRLRRLERNIFESLNPDNPEHDTS
jgi:predicted DNA binding protein